MMKTRLLLVLLASSTIGWAQPKPRLVVSAGDHNGRPTGSFSPDGKLMVTTDVSSARLWDVASGKFIAHLGPYTIARFTSDGKSIALENDDGVKFWSIAEQKVTSELNGGIQLLPEKNQYVEYQETSTTLFDLATRKPLHTVKTGPHGTTSANGRFMGFWRFKDGSDETTVDIFDVASGKKRMTLGRPGSHLRYVLFSPSADFIITGREAPFSSGNDDGDGTWFIWNTATRKVDSLDGKNFRPVFSNDGKRLATISGDPNDNNQDWEPTARVWDVATHKLLLTLEGHHQTLTTVLFSPDGRLLATASLDTTAIIWDAATGKPLRKLSGHTDLFRLCEFSRDGKYLATGSFDRSVKIWDVATGALVHSLEGQSFPTTLALPSLTNSFFITAVPSTEPQILLGSGRSTNTLFEGNRTAIIWDVQSGKPAAVVQHDDDIRTFQFSPDDKYIVTGGWDRIAKVWELGTGRLVHRLTGHEREVDEAYFTPGGNYVITRDVDGVLKIWNAATGEHIRNMELSRFTHVEVTPDDQYIGVVAFKSVGVWNLKTNEQKISVHDTLLNRNLCFSPDGNWCLLQSDKNAHLWNIRSGKLIRSWKPHARTMGDIQFSPTGSMILINTEDSVSVWSNPDGKLLATFGFKTNYRAFTRDNKYLALAADRNDTTIAEDSWLVYETTNFKRVQTRRRNFLDFVELLGDKLLLTNRNDSLTLWSVSTGKTLSTIVVPEGVKAVRVSSDEKMMYVTTTDGSVRIYAGENLDKLLLTHFQMGLNDWVVTHPGGLFDASPGAMDKLYFLQGLDIIEFNQLKERYYEPNLWKKVMTGEKLRDVVGFKSIDLPPDVRLGPVDEQGYLPIQLTNRGGGIGEVSVYINGKEAIRDARDAGTKTDAPSLSLKVYVGNNKGIVRGTQNFIAVKAWNGDHWVVSRSQVVTLDDKGVDTYKPAIHILTCGISDYTGNEIDLKFAAKDANDVGVALQLGAKQLFGTDRSYVYTLTTSGARESFPTKTNILTAFQQISATAHPRDVVVVYLSGHGVNVGGADGDWYYLTQEAYTASASAYNDPAIRSQTTLSSNELVELFKKIPALKQVLLIDACASGKVVDNLMAKKDISSNTLRALDRMRDRTGMHIITGCTADAVSYEATKYGQGVLTYSLLEGIRGAALREDQYVDINKLFQYAQDRVPQLAEGVGGIQSPQVFSPQGSQSFDIGLLTDDEKKNIPIARIRPVFVRSNFQDANDLEDVLGLSKMVDESLNEVSSKGSDASIIFVDVRDYPEACKFSGLYKKDGSTYQLKLKKRCGTEDKSYDLKGNSAESLKAEVLKIAN